MKDYHQLSIIKSLELLLKIKSSNLSMLLEIGNEHELTAIQIGNKKLFFPATVDLLHAFLNIDQKSIIKTPKVQKFTAEAIGHGLISTDQEEWVSRRKEVKGIFNLNQINELLINIKQTIEDQLASSPSNTTLENLLHAISISVIGQVFFGELSKKDGDQIKAAVNRMNGPTFQKIINPIPFFVDPLNKIIPSARKQLLEIISRNISNAREKKDDNLVNKYYPSGSASEDISNIFLAGFETTSNSLFWLFYEISKNEIIKNNISKELNSIRNFDTYESLKTQIPYTIATVRETFRLYPPIWIMSRTTIEEVSIGSHQFPKDTDIILSPYVFHRMEKYWKEHDVFDPTRFLIDEKENEKDKFPWYIPFGFGVRSCIGERLALLEIYLVLYYMFRNYSFSIESKEIKPFAHFTLRPSASLSITLIKK